uniref:Uncharacterized protein n=1 Tax=Clastoptera arizonana TaxID=38151 RepID=A0A1B6DVM9_9HEMI
MTTELEQVWIKNTTSTGLTKSKCEEWWPIIVQKYSEEGRHYHNIESLEKKFQHFKSIESSLKDPVSVTFAIIFQYFEYDPKAVDCHSKNIQHFKRFFKESGISNENPTFTNVITLLETADTSSTDENKIDGLFGNEDKHYFLDLDMVVLGSAPEDYADYAAKVQQEYSFLPDSLYKNLRSKVLQNFLQIPNIFATKEFRENYEQQARSNIQKEVESLI